MKSKKQWHNHINEKIGMQLAIYYNRCIQNDWTLSNDHNKIRQIFLKKEGI